MEKQTSASKEAQKTILVVEDEETILKFISLFLSQSGLHVLAAQSGEEAMKHSKEYDGPIHLLLSDIQMQGITGIELGTKLTAERPDMKVMLMSGFASGMLILNSGWQFLPKPFVPTQLRDAILNMLASPDSVKMPDIDERAK